MKATWLGLTLGQMALMAVFIAFGAPPPPELYIAILVCFGVFCVLYKLDEFE